MKTVTIGNQTVFVESPVGETIYQMEKGFRYRVGVVTAICDHYGPAVVIEWPDRNTKIISVSKLKPFTKRSRQGYFYKAEPSGAAPQTD